MSNKNLDNPLVVHKKSDASYYDSNENLEMNETLVMEDNNTLKRHRFKKEKSNEPYTKVHVLGTQSSGSGTFRTRFFESPKERYTKDHRNKNGVLIKGHSTGKLPEIHMFARGFRNAESSMLSMKAYIEEQINIINKKRMS